MKFNIANLSEEYLQDVLVRIAHHSSAIEGNTISLADTVSILIYNTIPSKINKREFFEVENHREAFKLIIDNIFNKKELSISLIKEIHAKLTDRLINNPGEFKNQENAILGADFQTSPSSQVSTLMIQWVDNLNYRLINTNEDNEKIKIILESHIEFERIHPFSDGNGRAGRLLMNYSLLYEGLVPIIIESNKKTEYINFLAKQNVDGFYDFAKELSEKEATRIQQFNNKKNSLTNLE